MIIYLTGANFSSSNIGQIDTCMVSINTSGTILANWTDPEEVSQNSTANTFTVKKNSKNLTITISGLTDLTSDDCSTTVGTGTFSSGIYTVTVSRVESSNIKIKAIASSTGGGDEPTPNNTYTFTINPTPTSATVTLTASGYTQSGNSITVPNGTTVSWRVSASGYTEQSGTWTANGSNKTENVVLVASGGGAGTTTWYIDHRSQIGSAVNDVNIQGRGWTHPINSTGYNAYVGKPVNTMAFFTNKSSQNVTVGKVATNGSESDMEVIATVTATTNGTKQLATISFPTVTLAQGEHLVFFADTNEDIHFYYASSITKDDNGINDSSFVGRVPKVYGSGDAWSTVASPNNLMWSIGYTS